MKASKKLSAKTTISASKRAEKRVAKSKKSKVKTLSKLKTDLDIVFGRFIKYRDGHMENGQWVVPCITCHKSYVYRDSSGKRYTVLQAGHFMSRGLGATRYHEQNVNGQCTYCNKWLSGDQYKHGLEIDKKFGPGTAAMLFDLSRSDFKFKREWLEEKIVYYSQLIEKYETLW